MHGTITEDGTGTPLANVEVTLHDYLSGYLWGGISDGSGNYEILAPVGPLMPLAGDHYRLKFVDLTGLHVIEYANERPSSLSGDDFAFSGSDSLVNESLASSGFVYGKVFDSVLNPLAGVAIFPYDAACNPVSPVIWRYPSLAAGGSEQDLAISALNGEWGIGGLTAGDYKLQFSGPSGEVWYPDQPDCASAPTITVVASTETDLGDVVMP